MAFVGRRLIERASPINTWNLRSSAVKPRMRFAPQRGHHQVKGNGVGDDVTFDGFGLTGQIKGNIQLVEGSTRVTTARAFS